MQIAIAIAVLGAVANASPAALLPSFENWGTTWDDLTFVSWAAKEECGDEFALAVQNYLGTVERHPDRAPLVYNPTHHGLGDRLKGITALFVLAVLTERPFRIVTTSHFSSRFIEPATFAWNIDKVPEQHTAFGHNRSHVNEAQLYNSTAYRTGTLLDYSRAVVSTNNQIVDFTSVMCDDSVPRAGKLFACAGPAHTQEHHAHWTASNRDAFCVLATLLRPTAPLVARLRSLLDRPSAVATHTPRLVLGLHVRYGGIRTDPLRATDANAATIRDCAEALMRAWVPQFPPYIHPHVTVVAISDVPARLHALLQSLPRRIGVGGSVSVVSSSDDDGSVNHNLIHDQRSQRGNEADEQIIFRGWLDFWLMNSAHAAVYFRSGFSRLALIASVNRVTLHGIAIEFSEKSSPQCLAAEWAHSLVL